MAGKKLVLQISLRGVGTDDELTVTLPCGFQDRAAFERHFRTSAMCIDVAVREWLKAATDDATFEGALAMRDEWLAFLAWRQVRRVRGDVPPFPAFLDTLEEVSVDSAKLVDEESPDPTGQAAASVPAATTG